METKLLESKKQNYRIEGGRVTTVWHRRAGKDDTAENFCAVASQIRIGSYWHLFPTYKQGRRAIWNGVKASGQKFIDAFPGSRKPGGPGIVLRKREDEMLIEFKNGSYYQVVGTDDLDSLVGANPVGLIVSEFALQDPRAMQLLEPIMAENGGWIWYTYTPRGRNHGHSHYLSELKNPKHFSQLLTIKDTRRHDGTAVVTEEYVQNLVDAGKMSYEMSQQEFYCSWDVGMEGAYYTTQVKKAKEEGRWMCDKARYEPNVPVDTFWDLGRKDYMTVVFTQRISPREIRIIDCYWNCGEDMRHYIKVVRDKPYLYGEHWAPHDINVTELTANNLSRKEVARRLGVRFNVMKKVGSIQERIDATRRMLHMCWFNSNCKEMTDEKGLLSALEQYMKLWNSEKQIFSDQPDKGWPNHFADAFGGMCMTYDIVPRQKPDQTFALDQWDNFDHDQGQNRNAEADYDMFNHKNQIQIQSGSTLKEKSFKNHAERLLQKYYSENKET